VLFHETRIDCFPHYCSYVNFLSNSNLYKREAFRPAFRGFDPKFIIRCGEKDIAQLLANLAIIRSKAKINVTIAGAQIYLDMLESGEDLSTFVWNFIGRKPIQSKGPMPMQTPLSAQLFVPPKSKGFKSIVIRRQPCRKEAPECIPVTNKA
jgi:3-methyladenine DNA glycosylase Tag